MRAEDGDLVGVVADEVAQPVAGPGACRGVGLRALLDRFEEGWPRAGVRAISP
ncbi:hypothetical protein [Streptomyces sp. NPDC090021]|uniref:hypothetical protein n=1 Tax=Streptomyces sp. NPDC090021 TaxID=3365919 RepID=UPI00381E1AF9